MGDYPLDPSAPARVENDPLLLIKADPFRVGNQRISTRRLRELGWRIGLQNRADARPQLIDHAMIALTLPIVGNESVQSNFTIRRVRVRALPNPTMHRTAFG